MAVAAIDGRGNAETSADVVSSVYSGDGPLGVWCQCLNVLIERRPPSAAMYQTPQCQLRLQRTLDARADKQIEDGPGIAEVRLGRGSRPSLTVARTVCTTVYDSTGECNSQLILLDLCCLCQSTKATAGCSSQT